MALTESQPALVGTPLPSFQLPATNGKIYSPHDFQDARALIVIFMCNHCPYVIAVQERINALAKEFQARGVQLIGINSNDVDAYPSDSFENMKRRAQEQTFVFPYLWDETQDVARAFDAACTPDPYVYANEAGRFVLRYRGRIDDSWKDPARVEKRELAEAVEALLAGRAPSERQNPAMGCNIKWKKVYAPSQA